MAEMSQRVQTIMLDRLELCVMHAISRGELMAGDDNLQLLEPMAGAMVFQLSHYVAGLKETVTVDYPADWWEAVKQRFAPQWFLRHYPVRMTRHTVNAWRLWRNAPKFPLDWGGEIRIAVAQPLSTVWSPE